MMGRRFFALLCLLVVTYALFQACFTYTRRNDGFTVLRITSTIENSPRWDIPVSVKQTYIAQEILKQPFYYLDHGFQCYVFVSQDGQYVLKFLRHQRLRPPVIFDWLPQVGFVGKLKAKKIVERAKRAEELFQSLKVGFLDAPDETGLLFLRLNKSPDFLALGRKVTIYDKSGQQHLITLDDKEFALQKKAAYIQPTIDALMENNCIEDAKERINQIFALLVNCAKKGVLDEDRALIHKDNIGFLPDRAIYIDAGRLVKRSALVTKAYLKRDLQRLYPLQKWLTKHYPVLASHFERVKKMTLEDFEA